LCDHKPNALDYVRIARRLHAKIRRCRPDAIVAHTHYANILALCVGWLAHVQIRVAVQHNPVQTYPGISRHADWLCGSLGIYTKQVAVSDVVVKSMEAYPARYRRTVERIYNGITFGEETGELLCKAGVFRHSGPKILHVGRFSAQKNHDALLEVLARLPAASLVLVGDGERKNDIERRVQDMKLQDRVTFLGEIGPKEVRAVMRSCDLFMFPSIYEAMPMALLEAMATGMPIVASDIPANRELVQDAGVLRTLDPEQFASAAMRLFADPKYAADLGKQAAERASQFTVAAMADGYERILLAS
jgi:glycosyltransferase involved in cell wall biosynthesis